MPDIVATLAPRARLANLDDIEAIQSVDQTVFPDPNHWVSTETLKHWISEYPGNNFVMEDHTGKIIGRAVCLPVCQDVLAKLREPSFLRDPELANFLIPAGEAKRNSQTRGVGNIFFLEMTAFDPATGKERYDTAIPLLLAYLFTFKKQRMRAVVGRSHTQSGHAVWHYSGATEISVSTENTTVWKFDGNDAAKNICSGLSVIYYTNWAFESMRTALRLSPRQREIIQLLADATNPDVTNKEIGGILGITENAVKDQLKLIFAKGEKAGVFRPYHRNRVQLINYCHDHPEEIVPMLEKLPIRRRVEKRRDGLVGADG